MPTHDVCSTEPASPVAVVIHEVEAGDSPISVVVFGHRLEVDDFWPLFNQAASEYSSTRTWDLRPTWPPAVSHGWWTKFTNDDDGNDVRLSECDDPDSFDVWWWGPTEGYQDDAVPVTFCDVWLETREVEGDA